MLGSKDENDVQGYTGTPTNVNALTFDANLDIGAAGVQFPRLQRFFISVDSRADEFTNRSQKGRYILNSWVNDLTPPAVRMLTTRVTAGRPLIVAQAFDLGAGVDPLSLVINYNRALVGASLYDPLSGLIVFGIPAAGAEVQARQDADDRARVRLPGGEERQHHRQRPDAEHRFLQTRLTVVNGPTVTWIEPPAHVCAAQERRSRRGRRVHDQGERRWSSATTAARSASTRPGPAASSASWHTTKLKRGVHHLTATVVDRSGRRAAAGRQLNVCK